MRRVEIAGIIRQPHGAWMVQVARNLLDIVDGFLKNKRFLLLDRDPLYTSQFRPCSCRHLPADLPTGAQRALLLLR